MLFLEDVTAFSCGGAEVLRVLKFVMILINIVLFIIPMGLIIMVSIDFGKNVISGKEDEMKKNVQVAIKRIMFAVMLFLINPIVSFSISFLGDLGVDYASCINIARDDDELWKYTIDWDYYPYGGREPVSTGNDYVIWERMDESGNVIGYVIVYDNGKVEEY